MVWNHCPYWGSFLSMNNSWTGCMSALGVLKQLGYFVPFWSWLFWTPLSLKHSGLWKSLACTFLCSKQGCPPFLAKQFPSPQNLPQSSYTHFWCTCVVLGLEREEERDRESVCVQSLHSQSRNNFRWRRVRETQISHDITYLWHLRKWTYLQNRLTEKELTVTKRDSVRGRLYGKFGIDVYTRLYFNGWPTRTYCIKQRILLNIL